MTTKLHMEKIHLALVSGSVWVVLVLTPNPITGDPGMSIHPALKTWGYWCRHTSQQQPCELLSPAVIHKGRERLDSGSTG